MAKPNCIELSDETRIPILYEDRSVMAIDKPRSWMLVPFSWQNTNRNLQAAISSSIAAGDYWARSRNLKYLRNIHRLDADTSGVLLFAKSQGGLETYSDMFETRKMTKVYLVVVHGTPKQAEWTCELPIAQNPDQIGKVHIDFREGKDAVTHFKVKQTQGAFSLLEARPVTGRTHQIRIHLMESGHPVAGDDLYGPKPGPGKALNLGLRAVYLSYPDPFLRRVVHIQAPVAEFMSEYRFKGAEEMVRGYFAGGNAGKGEREKTSGGEKTQPADKKDAPQPPRQPPAGNGKKS